MCGIYGVVGNSFDKVEKIFSDCLNHRGPDNSDSYYDNSNKLILGQTRLSIIDLSSGGDQPKSDVTGRFTITFNGEIYNYKEIRDDLVKRGHIFNSDSDTEVILESYKAWGKNCLNHFRGMFAFVIYNKDNKTLFIARDRFGIKPLYYSFINNQFIFSSEIKPFVKSGLVPKKISPQGLLDYHSFGSVQQPNTIYDGIFALMPASYMVVDIKDLNYSIDKYYSYDKNVELVDNSIDFKEASVIVRNSLEEATKYHLISDVEVGAFLSGGIDSTAIVALMAQYSTKPIKTFTVGFSNKTEAIDETSIAKNVAKQLGTDHHEIIIETGDVNNLFDGYIKSLDQPSMDGLNTYIVSKEVSKYVKVALSGLGGDEIFAGYNHFGMISEQIRKKPSIVTNTFQRINNYRPNRLTKKYAFVGMTADEAAFQKRYLLNSKFESNYLHFEKSILPKNINNNLSIFQQISKFEIDKYLLNTLLRDSDVMSMSHSIEVRPILLDHKLLEVGFGIADKYKIKNNLNKAIFVEAVKDIIPADVWQRKKSGFEMPYVFWMNYALKARIERVLKGDFVNEIFTESYINIIKSQLKTSTIKRSFWKDFVLLEWMANNE